MALPGKFEVSPTGAASYTIPIAVPPGSAGMVPSLSISYNSQGRNGLLGMGWHLEGLPSIGRCPRTIAQDGVRGSVNYDADDRFCLDGQRLVAISGTYGADGTEYRTEIESFAKIISRGTAGTGPAWFEVWTKSGQRMEFGNTADSRVLAQGKTHGARLGGEQGLRHEGELFHRHLRQRHHQRAGLPATASTTPAMPAPASRPTTPCASSTTRRGRTSCRPITWARCRRRRCCSRRCRPSPAARWWPTTGSPTSRAPPPAAAASPA